MDNKKKKVIRIASRILFFCYIMLLIYLMFFSEHYGRTHTDREYRYNMELFQEIRRFLKYRELLGFDAVLVNIFGNVVGFMPVGFFLPLVHRNYKNFWTVLMITFGITLFIEVTQLIFKVGIFDVDDLLMNTIGGILGYVLYFCCNKLRRKFYG